MLRFLSNVSANLVSLFIFFFILPAMFFIALMFVALKLTVGFVGEVQRVENHGEGALVFDMSQNIVESASVGGGFEAIMSNGRAMSTYDICEKINLAAQDSQRNVIFIHGSFDDAFQQPSFAQISEIRDQLEFFKSRGGMVCAYLQNPSLRDYYLASVANRIIMNPKGSMEFRGLATNSPYFGNALKKYGIDVQVVKSGKYKNFGEMFTADKMSAEDKLHLGSVIDYIWGYILSSVSASRGIAVEKLETIASQKGVFSADSAKEFGLVDELMYQDEVISLMRNTVGEKDGIFLQSPISEYGAVALPRGGCIAVVYMSGTIMENGGRDTISSAMYAPLIRGLREDPSVKGIVLRIDSGGGSAYASEEIRREVELAAQQKPVVASFGAVAASGAYWIATAANSIFLDPETITGSIGVFGLAFSAEKFAADFGITFDGAKTSPLADMGTLTRPMNAVEVSRMQAMIDDVYADFVNLVSNSRGIPRDEVVEIANGRIYSAGHALELKLADKVGGVMSAVLQAYEATGATGDFYVEQYPQTDSLRELFKDFEPPAPYAGAAANMLKPLGKCISILKTFDDSKKIYVRIPFEVELN